jgi:hypothetical protein
MQSFTADQMNTIGVDLVNKSDGEPIIAGTVNLYLVARSGINSGKWWSFATETWSAVEISAGAMTHESDSQWTVDVVAGAWDTGVRYRIYAKESGDLHVPYSEEITEVSSPQNWTVEATVDV